MKKALLLLLVFTALACYAQEGWYYDETSGLYATSDGYYYYFYEPLNGFYYAYDPTNDFWYYYDYASGQFYPWGTSDTTYESYDQYADTSGGYDYSGGGSASAAASGGGAMDQASFDIMYDTMMMQHETSMNIINNMADTDVDYYYYDDGY
jgi:hypothetical protein